MSMWLLYIPVQRITTSFAEIGTVHVVGIMAVLTNLSVFFDLRHFDFFEGSNRQYARYSNNTITQYHYNRCQKPTRRSDRRNVSVADGGQCDQCPINSSRNGGNARLRCVNFKNIHKGTEYNSYQKHKR